MAAVTRIEPIARDIQAIIRESLSPAAKSRVLAQFARETINEARDINRRALGKVPPYQTFVDGQKSEALERVRPDGVIVAEFDLISGLLGFVSEQLWVHSPVKTGRYRKSHRIFADGALVGEVANNTRALAAPGGRWTSGSPDAREWVFVSVVPYARRIERGWSRQAPDGVYQAVAALARRRFGNMAKIQFTYRGVTGLSFRARRSRRPPTDTPDGDPGSSLVPDPGDLGRLLAAAVPVLLPFLIRYGPVLLKAAAEIAPALKPDQSKPWWRFTKER